MMSVNGEEAAEVSGAACEYQPMRTALGNGVRVWTDADSPTTVVLAPSLGHWISGFRTKWSLTSLRR